MSFGNLLLDRMAWSAALRQLVGPQLGGEPVLPGVAVLGVVDDLAAHLAVVDHLVDHVGAVDALGHTLDAVALEGGCAAARTGRPPSPRPARAPTCPRACAACRPAPTAASAPWPSPPAPLRIAFSFCSVSCICATRSSTAASCSAFRAAVCASAAALACSACASLAWISASFAGIAASAAFMASPRAACHASARPRASRACSSAFALLAAALSRSNCSVARPGARSDPSCGADVLELAADRLLAQGALLLGDVHVGFQRLTARPTGRSPCKPSSELSSRRSTSGCVPTL